MPCANPLFLRWVKEFHNEKSYKKRGGPPRPTGYENAIRSIQSCTVKYDHPRQLLNLNGVGPTCVERLTEKLEAYCERKGIEMPEPPAKKGRAAGKQKTETTTEATEKPVRRKRDLEALDTEQEQPAKRLKKRAITDSDDGSDNEVPPSTRSRK